MTGSEPEALQGDDATPATEHAGDQPIRVTTLELFFDLIFAFTLTQLAVVLTPGKTHVWATSVLRVLLIFGLLWWMYGGYAWLTNTRSPARNPERLLLVFGMTGFLIVGLAIPQAFGGDGVAFGLGYLLVVLVHAVLYARVNRQIWRIAPFNVTSALLVIAAGFTSGIARYALWVAALVIQAGAPLVVRLGGRFEIRPGHFAERHLEDQHGGEREQAGGHRGHRNRVPGRSHAHHAERRQSGGEGEPLGVESRKREIMVRKEERNRNHQPAQSEAQAERKRSARTVHHVRHYGR